MSKSIRFLFVFFAMVVFPRAHAGIAVIVNRQTDLKSLSLEELSEIYLGKVRSFPNGNSAIPSLNANKNLNTQFLQRVVDKSPSEFDSYWNVRQFTAKGSSPRLLSDDEAVKEWVGTHASGLGFVNESSLEPSEKHIKTVLIIPTVAKKD